MVELSVQLEGNLDLTWDLWKQHVEKVEDFGFAGLFRSDHFAVPEPDYPDVLELIVSLTYLADHTRHLRFGPCVAPVSYRDPVTLLFQAIALSSLSDGRMVLGLGAGWMEREHLMFGYDLGSVKTRMDRLEEALEVITQLLQGEHAVTYTGRFFHLRGAKVRPLPASTGALPIMIGGRGIRRTLPLVARYADIWNVNLVTADEFRARSEVLNQLMMGTGRQRGGVKRTFMTPVVCGRDDAELEHSSATFRSRIAGGRHMPLPELLTHLRTEFHAIVGNPDQVVEQIQAYGDAGADEVIVQFYDQTDFQLLDVLGRDVLPHFKSSTN